MLRRSTTFLSTNKKKAMGRRQGSSRISLFCYGVVLISLMFCISPVCGFWSSSSSSTEAEADADDGFLTSPIVNREIEAQVHAPWPTSPYNVLCEAMAFYATSSGRHKEFLEVLVEAKVVLEEEKDEDATSSSDITFEEAAFVALDVATQMNMNKGDNDEDTSLLEYSLAMRAKAPTCELHRTMAVEYGLQENVEAFVVLQDGTVVTLIETLSKHQTSGTEQEGIDPLLLLPNESPIVPKEAEYDDSTESNFVVLYATLGTPLFLEWYEALQSSQLPFVVRHYLPPRLQTSDRTLLQGYGVRLDIRNIEYKVFDDTKGTAEDSEDKLSSMINVTSLDKVLPHSLAGVNLTKLQEQGMLTATEGKDETLALQEALWRRQEAQHTTSELVPPTWARRQLSLQAAHAISTMSNDPLLTLQDIAQNLPSVASNLVSVQVPESFSELVQSVEEEQILEPLQGLYVNGRRVSVDRPSFNVFEWIQLLQSEQKALQDFQKTLGPYIPKELLSVIQKEAWMKGSEISQGDGSSSSKSSSNYRIDVGRGGKGAIIYLNDIEKDAMYAGWSRSPQQMMQMMQFGMPPSIRRNVFTLLAVMDPIQPSSSHATLQLAFQLIQGQYPARLGVLIASQTDIDECQRWVLGQGDDLEKGEPCPVEGPLFGSTRLTTEYLKQTPATARLVHTLVTFVLKKNSSQIAMAYVPYLEQSIQGKLVDGNTLTMLDLLEIHGGLLQQFGVSSNSGSEIIQELAKFSTEDHDYGKSVRFAVDKGLSPGMGFLNGVPLPASSLDDDEEEVMEKLGLAFNDEQNHIFQMIMEGELTEVAPRNLYFSLLKGSNVFPRIHPLLFKDSKNEQNFDVSHDLGSETLWHPQGSEQDLSKMDAFFVVEGFFHLDSLEGLEMAKSFVETMSSYTSEIDGEAAIGFRILPTTSSPSVCSTLDNSNEMSADSILETLSSLQTGKTDRSSSGACRRFRYLEAPDNKGIPLPKAFVSVNGNMYIPEKEQKIEKVDIDLLISMELGRSRSITSIFQKHSSASDSTFSLFEAVSRTSAYLSSSEGKSTRRMDPDSSVKSAEIDLALNLLPLRFSWNQDSGGAVVTAVVDPVSDTAQRLSSLLLVIRDHLKLPLTVLLAPKSVLDGDSKIPISSYYRFVSDSRVFQDVASGPIAAFANLPTSHTLTMRMDVPEPWDIQQSKSIQDTDNLRCEIQSGCSDDDHDMISRADESVHGRRHLTRVEYSLKSLLFFGQCYESDGSPPNGLQLTLTSPSSPLNTSAYSDTLVMKNVGYWQLRANPGVWNLNIKENSRGAEIFDMVDGKVSRGSIKVIGELANNSTKPLVMGDFVSRSEMLVVRRRPGYNKATLFYEKEKSVADSETIHVFSLATGHLYERFLKIMMLSVTKRTSTKVKFWLFENFLSPAFKSSARAMAKQIGCEVEFVTYKWPEWLRGQSEKQRIIWGYKILFLDVLFPLDVKKVIYVDADQVIRGDLKELWDMNLEGAPYGYVPMCSSRESTLGFQFWNTGFWESHLRGRPYHISALYVVDLDRFRKMLVGDQLRSIYQSLSADPNSLANLDQDLPNYAQHQVPIFSLPQEWLWCESWCSDETKATAKTIDLCNNPLHKEPKVSMAKRIISGHLFNESWVELDAQVESYETEYFESMME